MIMTIRPGSMTVEAGTATCASTLATATAVPGRSPVQAAASSVRPPARSPMTAIVARHLLVDDVRQARVERLEVGRVGEAVALRPHRLVAGGIGLRVSTPVSRQTTQSAASISRSAGRRRRAPRRGSGAPCEEPLGADLAAVRSSQPSPSRAGDLVDPVRLGLGGVVLPQLHPRVGVGAQLGQDASGVPSAVTGSIVQAVKSMPRPMTSAGSTPLSRRTAGTVAWNTRR